MHAVNMYISGQNRIMKRFLLYCLLFLGFFFGSCQKSSERIPEHVRKRMMLIKDIAEANPEGFTIYSGSLEFVKHGWVVGMLATQNSFGDEGLLKVIQVADTTTGTMGGWLEEDLFYWDACYIVEDEETATELGRRNKQIAIYHLDTGTIKYL